jgi:hypothetical protein
MCCNGLIDQPVWYFSSAKRGWYSWDSRRAGSDDVVSGNFDAKAQYYDTRKKLIDSVNIRYSKLEKRVLMVIVIKVQRG